MSRFSKATKRGRRTSRSVVLPNKAGGSETSRLEDEKEGEERRGEESGANCAISRRRPRGGPVGALDDLPLTTYASGSSSSSRRHAKRGVGAPMGNEAHRLSIHVMDEIFP